MIKIKDSNETWMNDVAGFRYCRCGIYRIRNRQDLKLRCMPGAERLSAHVEHVRRESRGRWIEDSSDMNAWGK